MLGTTRSAVLYAEDDPNDVLFMRYAWLKAGVPNPLKVVHDGGEVLRYLAGEGLYADRGIYPAPCLVLLDLKMPLVSGLDALRWIRAQPTLQGLRVIMLSSSKHDFDLDVARKHRAEAYFVKPLRLDEWVGIVERLNDSWLEEPST